ncbi:MAG: hypothetical protein RBT63_03530 [Bdellovibrionales bacterium]|jgi:hypothetical protein|nr:hypothetical protein [Bdellovibrionales bacterium]
MKHQPSQRRRFIQLARSFSVGVTCVGTFCGIQLLALFLSMAPSSANAATIEKVRGTQAVVVFSDGETVPKAGARLFATENGKRRAVLQVVRTSKTKAIVKITRGKVTEGMEVSAAGGRRSAPQDADSAALNADNSSNRHPPRSAGAATLFKNMTFGVLGGYAMDSQNVKTPSAIYDMTGAGFSAKGFTDIPVTGSLSLMARAGVEMFNVQAETVKTEITYAVVDLMLKYSFTEGTFVPFAMAGLGLHFPVSKTSDVLDINRVSSTTVFYGGGGINWALGPSTYIQLSGEYGMFPPSDNVSTSLIAVRGGLGFRL